MQQAIGFTLNDILAAARVQSRTPGFITALAFTLNQEGVYYEVVDGDDGGATCCGITQSDYDHYRSAHGLATRSVAQIDVLEVSSTYWEHYWNLLGCDNWQAPVRLFMFDTSVNEGVGEAVETLQHVTGVTVDGVLGPGTQSAEHDYVVKHGSVALGLALIARRRATYYEIAAAHPNDEQFLSDWLRRCDDLEKAIEG